MEDHHDFDATERKAQKSSRAGPLITSTSTKRGPPTLPVGQQPLSAPSSRSRHFTLHTKEDYTKPDDDDNDSDEDDMVVCVDHDIMYKNVTHGMVLEDGKRPLHYSGGKLQFYESYFMYCAPYVELRVENGDIKSVRCADDATTDGSLLLAISIYPNIKLCVTIENKAKDLISDMFRVKVLPMGSSEAVSLLHKLQEEDGSAGHSIFAPSSSHVSMIPPSHAPIQTYAARKKRSSVVATQQVARNTDPSISLDSYGYVASLSASSSFEDEDAYLNKWTRDFLDSSSPKISKSSRTGPASSKKSKLSPQHVPPVPPLRVPSISTTKNSVLSYFANRPSTTTTTTTTTTSPPLPPIPPLFDEPSSAIVILDDDEPPDANQILFIFPHNTVGAVTMRKRDKFKLKPGTYLNDNIINFHFIEQVHQLLGHEEEQRVHVFSSFFFSKLAEVFVNDTLMYEDSPMGRQARFQAFDQVRKWSYGEDIFRKRLLLIPINRGLHWSLCLVLFDGDDASSPPRGQILTVDSFNDESPHRTNHIAEIVRIYLNHEYEARVNRGEVIRRRKMREPTTSFFTTDSPDDPDAITFVDAPQGANEAGTTSGFPGFELSPQQCFFTKDTIPNRLCNGPKQTESCNCGVFTCANVSKALSVLQNDMLKILSAEKLAHQLEMSFKEFEFDSMTANKMRTRMMESFDDQAEQWKEMMELGGYNKAVTAAVTAAAAGKQIATTNDGLVAAPVDVPSLRVAPPVINVYEKARAAGKSKHPDVISVDDSDDGSETDDDDDETKLLEMRIMS